MSINPIVKALTILALQSLVINTVIGKSLVDMLPIKIQNCVNAADEAAILASKFKDTRDIRSGISHINTTNLPQSESNKLKGLLIILHLSESKDIDPAAIRIQYYLSCSGQAQ